MNIQAAQATPRNPIQRSFGAGINAPKVIPNKRSRRVKHREREIEYDEQ